MDNDTREILLIMQEECAEVTQAISKCFRFGPDQVRPGSSQEEHQTNIQKLEEELGDLQAMIDLIVKAKVGITSKGITEAKKLKFLKLKEWSNISINK